MPTMKRSLYVLALFTCLVPLVASAAGPAERAAELNERWDEAFNRGDAGAVASLYEENAIVSADDGDTVHGRDSIEELFQGFIDFGVHDHNIEVIEVHRSGNVLYQIARWQAKGPAGDAEEPPTFGGVLVTTHRRDGDGGWKIHVHSWNSMGD